MLNWQILTFLKNVLVFLVNRFYKARECMFRNDRSCCENISERGDLYTKQLIENIVIDRARKCDPCTVKSASISYGMACLVLCEAHVTGLSTLRQTDICALTEVEKRLFVSANLGAGPLFYQCEIVFKFGSFERRSAIIVSLADIEIMINLSFQKMTGRNGHLLSLYIKELKGFKLRLSGFGRVSWIINLQINFWILVLGRMIRNLLKKIVQQHISDILPKYQFPVEGASYRKESKSNSSNEDDQNSKESLSESNNTKSQDNVLHKTNTMAVSLENIEKECTLMKHGSEKNMESNLKDTKTSARFQQEDRCTAGMSSYCLLRHSSGLNDGTLIESSNAVSCSREICSISKPINTMNETRNAVSCIHDISTNSSLNILEDYFSLSDWEVL